MGHIPVLLDEVLHGLDPQAGDLIIDCTFGDGGHARALLEHIGPSGRILAIDADERNIDLFRKRFPTLLSHVALAHGNFACLESIASAHKFESVQGILFDLGWSSRQLEDGGRGFSFLRDEPLDMRMDSRQSETAADILNNYSSEDLGFILRTYGEEPCWRQIVRAICDRRKRCTFQSTFDLVETVETVIKRRGALHPATRVFQALRIAVNHELENLENALSQAYRLLAPCGRLAVISFHSLEDRIVKRFFYASGARVITKKPIIPSRAEIQANRRARSAKLRIIQK